MPELPAQDFAEVHALIERVRKLYETLVLVPWGDIERRRERVVGDRGDSGPHHRGSLPPATNPL